MRSPPGRHPDRRHGTPRNASGHDSAPWTGRTCRPPRVRRQNAWAAGTASDRPSCSSSQRSSTHALIMASGPQAAAATPPGEALRRGRGRQSEQLAVGVAAGGGLVLGGRHASAEGARWGWKPPPREDLAERSPARRSTCRGEMRKLARSSRAVPCAWQPAVGAFEAQRPVRGQHPAWQAARQQ